MSGAARRDEGAQPGPPDVAEGALGRDDRDNLDQRRSPASRSPAVHGAIALDPAACTACDLCVTECPSWCIELTSHNEPSPGPGRTRTVKVLDTFSIDYGLCIYCGICVQVCPFDALAWVPEPVGDGNREAVVLEIDALAALWPQA